MNVFNFTGNLGADAISKNVKGYEIVEFSVATKEHYGKDKISFWVKCSFFGERAQKVMPYLTKGKRVFVSGRLIPREGTTRDGEIKTFLNVNVLNIELQPDSRRDQDFSQGENNDFVSDDIPF